MSRLQHLAGIECLEYVLFRIVLNLSLYCRLIRFATPFSASSLTWPPAKTEPCPTNRRAAASRMSPAIICRPVVASRRADPSFPRKNLAASAAARNPMDKNYGRKSQLLPTCCEGLKTNLFLYRFSIHCLICIFKIYKHIQF